MFNSLSDLAIWYPMLPVENDDTAFSVCRCIKDMRVAVGLPMHVDLSSVGVIQGTLTAADQSRLTVRVVVGDILDDIVDIPCYSSNNDVPGNAESFAIVDPGIPNVSGLNLRVHPDCLSMEVSRQPDDQYPLTVYDIDGSPIKDLSFNDGYNVGVQFKDGKLTFTARAGLGRGTYAATSQLMEDYARINDGLIKSAIKGIRSINGLTGTVKISSSSHIDLKVRKEKRDNGEDCIILRLVPTVVRRPERE